MHSAPPRAKGGAGEIYTLIDIDKATYSRCDNRCCDGYKPSVSKFGEFINLSLPENGLVVKIQQSDLSVVDVAMVSK